MSGLTELIFLALLGSVVALVGGVMFLYIDKWSKVLSKYSIPFAAGVLITVALVGLLPEAIHIGGEKSFLVVWLTFLGAYIFENLVCDLHHHDHGDSCKDNSGSVLLVIIGDTIHNFIDGVAIGASYLVNPGLGLVTALSTFLHEVPHEIGDFGILLKAGWKKKKIFMVNLGSALMTVAGALLVYFLNCSDALIGGLLAVAAGMFLYLGASDFLPHAGEGVDKKKAMMTLFFGAVIMYGTLSIIPHGHEVEKHDHGVTGSDPVSGV
ncbi:MAG: ZIP family metal transporter [Candidatus Beckwithbacteria bacterium]|nr:ZIP family metal transporter [Patescibacteria group bacterium]